MDDKTSIALSPSEFIKFLYKFSEELTSDENNVFTYGEIEVRKYDNEDWTQYEAHIKFNYIPDTSNFSAMCFRIAIEFDCKGGDDDEGIDVTDIYRYQLPNSGISDYHWHVGAAELLKKYKQVIKNKKARDEKVYYSPGTNPELNWLLPISSKNFIRYLYAMTPEVASKYEEDFPFDEISVSEYPNGNIGVNIKFYYFLGGPLASFMHRGIGMILDIEIPDKEDDTWIMLLETYRYCDDPSQLEDREWFVTFSELEEDILQTIKKELLEDRNNQNISESDSNALIEDEDNHVNEQSEESTLEADGERIPDFSYVRGNDRNHIELMQDWYKGEKTAEKLGKSHNLSGRTISNYLRLWRKKYPDHAEDFPIRKAGKRTNIDVHEVTIQEEFD